MIVPSSRSDSWLSSVERFVQELLRLDSGHCAEVVERLTSEQKKGASEWDHVGWCGMMRLKLVALLGTWSILMGQSPNSLAGIRFLRSRTKTSPRPDRVASWRNVAQIFQKKQRADWRVLTNKLLQWFGFGWVGFYAIHINYCSGWNMCKHIINHGRIFPINGIGLDRTRGHSGLFFSGIFIHSHQCWSLISIHC